MMSNDLTYTQGTVEGSPKELRVYLLNDLHFGAEEFDWDLWNTIKADMDKHKDHARILINGDLIDAVTKYSVGDLYKQRLTPEEQIEGLAREFEPYKDMIDAIIIGNHDARITKDVGIDPIKYFARLLGIEEKYKGYQTLVSYSFNKCHYSIQMFHGSGGGQTMQSVMNAAKKIRKTNCDIMYIAHHHIEMAQPFMEYDIDKYNHKLRKCKRWIICGNSMLKYAEYAEQKGYEERFTSQCVLTFSGNPNNKGVKIDWIRGWN